jgi:hypothetical protein
VVFYLKNACKRELAGGLFASLMILWWLYNEKSPTLKAGIYPIKSNDIL